MLDQQTDPFSGYDEDLGVDGSSGGDAPKSVRADFPAVRWTNEKLSEDEVYKVKKYGTIDSAKVEAMALRHLREYEDAYEPIHVEWNLNREYDAGDRGRQRKDRTTIKGAPPWKQHYSPNIAGSRIKTHIDMVCRRHWIERPRATSDDLDDEIVTEAAEAIAKHQDRQSDPRIIRRQAMEYAEICSMAFAKVSWNPNAGEVIEGGTHRGMVERALINPWDVYVDPTAGSFTGPTGMDNVRWWAHRYEVHEDELPSILSEDALRRVRQATKSSGDGSETSDLDDLRNPMGLGRTDGRRESRDNRKPYEVFEYRKRRTTTFKRGLMLHIVNRVVVDIGPLPYSDFDTRGALDLGVVAFNPRQVPGQFVGVALWSLLRDPQDVLRRVESKMLERLMTSATKIIKSGGGPVKGMWDDRDMQMIEFAGGGGKFDIVEMPLPRAEHYTVADRAMHHMDAITASWETARGEEGKSKTFGEAALLRDAAETSASNVVHALNTFMREVRKMEFLLIAQFYDTPRVVEIVGADDVQSAFYFTGADLEGLTDYEIVSDDVLPAGREARIAAARALVDLGQAIGTPIVSVQELRDLFGLGRSVLTEHKRIRKRARKTGLAILQGEPPPEVNQHEDHEIWVDVLADILQSSEYDRADPQSKAAFTAQLDLRASLLAIMSAPMMGGLQPPMSPQDEMGQSQSPPQTPGVKGSPPMEARGGAMDAA